MRRFSQMEDERLISIVEKFLESDKADDVVEWHNALYEQQITREQVYPIVREGRARGYLKATPPAHIALEGRFVDRLGLASDQVCVVRTRGEFALDHVARAAATKIVELIRKVQERKPGERIGIGLSGGGTVMRIARELASILSTERSLPPLRLHALTSGFDVGQPRTAPVSFLGFFDQSAPDIQYVSLFASPVVDEREYEKVKKNPGVRESFEQRKGIDIVVTSLADERDEHGELNVFLKKPRGGEATLAALRNAGWMADAMYRPYSADGPIELKKGIRAVSIFELSQLVWLARQPDKYVMVVAAACNGCLRPKGDALRPLLEQPRLRIWTHLMMDLDTALTVLPPHE